MGGPLWRRPPSAAVCTSCETRSLMGTFLPEAMRGAPGDLPAAGAPALAVQLPYFLTRPGHFLSALTTFPSKSALNFSEYSWLKLR